MVNSRIERLVLQGCQGVSAMLESYLKFLHIMMRKWRSGLFEKCRAPTGFKNSAIIRFTNNEYFKSETNR